MNELEYVAPKTFPLKLVPKFSEVVDKAVKQTPLNKQEWIVQAIKEKLQRDNEAV
jgi:Leu/Phe-tRNA-protein transferase